MSLPRIEVLNSASFSSSENVAQPWKTSDPLVELPGVRGELVCNEITLIRAVDEVHRTVARQGLPGIPEGAARGVVIRDAQGSGRRQALLVDGLPLDVNDAE